jgi:hypothetical protein
MSKLSRSQVARLGGLATARKDDGRYIRDLARKAAKTAGRTPAPTFDQIMATPEGRRAFRRIASEIGLSREEVTRITNESERMEKPR